MEVYFPVEHLSLVLNNLVLTEPLGLIHELSRALHKQLVQSFLDGFVRFGRRSVTHRPVTENVRQLKFCPVPHCVPGFFKVQLAYTN